MTRPVNLGAPAVGSPEWHDARRETLNGSEIAAVLGISAYDSPFSLWHRKAGHLGDVIQNGEMYWGTKLEDVIRSEFWDRHPEFLVLDGGGLWRHPVRTWQGGSPDGRLFVRENHTDHPDALLEVKTARMDTGWGDEGSDDIPVGYRSQCLWYLDVFGLSECRVAVLIAGSDYREYLIKFDEAEVAPMRAAAVAFLASLAGDPPPLDGHDATYQAVLELHPDIDGHEVELPGAVARPYLAALAAAQAAAVEKKRTAAGVVDAMGSAQHATWCGDRICSRIGGRSETKPPYLRAANGAAELLTGKATP